MSIIAHNLSAMNTSRQWGITDRKKSAIAEKLGSGYQINRAADNAAGLSISEKMRGQIRGLEQASKNIQDGISYVQVADGALNEVHSILQRMRELAVQAANDTNVDADREAIDAEIQQLKEEVDSILEKTEFNTRPVWDIHAGEKRVSGYVKKPAVVVNPWFGHAMALNNDNKYLIAKDFYTISATEEGMQVSWTDYYGGTHLVPEKTADGKDQYIPWPELDGPVLPNRPEVKTYLAQDFSVNVADYMGVEDKSTGIDFPIKFSITEGASVTDLVESLDGARYDSGKPGDIVLETDIAIDGIRFSDYPEINYEAVLALDSLASDAGGDKVSGVDFSRYDDIFLEATASDNVIEPNFDTMSGNWVFTFKNPNYPDVNFVAVSSNEIKYHVDSFEPEHEGVWWKTVYTNVGEVERTISYERTDNSTMEAINYALTNSDGSSMISDDTDDNGEGHSGRIFCNFTIQSDKPIQITNPDGTKTDIGCDIGTFNMYIDINADDTLTDVVNRMKQLQYVDIRSDFKNPNSFFGFYGVKEKQIDSPLWMTTPRGVNIQVGANMAQNIYMDYDAIRTYSIGLKDTNTLTRSDAGAAISEIDDAIELISAQRSYFGAMQNRMEHAHANADNTAENLQSSESRIRDTNMAEGMVEFSKLTILEQASQSMLSHANQANQGILQLLQ